MVTEKGKKVLQGQSTLDVGTRVAESVSTPADTKLQCLISSSAVRSGADLTGFGILCYTLVADRAIPMGFLQDFMKLETPARRAAKRQQASATSVSDSSAETRVRSLSKSFRSGYDHGSTRDCS